MTDEIGRDDDDLLPRLEEADAQALIELFTRHREPVRRMIRLCRCSLPRGAPPVEEP